MKQQQHQSLWRWICVRVLTLAIGSVILIALCMWLRFVIQNLWILHHMPPALREEFALLRQQPALNLARFHQIVDERWGISYSDPSIASSDWITVGVLVVIVIPFIVVFGLRSARPLSAQVSRLATAAGAVARGEFSTRAEQIQKAPTELIQLTENFNAMTGQLERYDRELRASHVAMAHELRSPLTAAIGRLQGMIDGVFEPEPQQLNMVMKQLQHLSRLTDELHLLSLADAGQLSLNKSTLDLTELLQERAVWLKPQAEAAGMAIEILPLRPCLYLGDPFRLAQVFTILMENALRYAAEGKRLKVEIRTLLGGQEIIFRDFGSGLGLSIARAICVAHGGTLRASLPESGGLQLTVFLPAVEF